MTALNLLETMMRLRSDIVVPDVRMPGVNGVVGGRSNRRPSSGSTPSSVLWRPCDTCSSARCFVFCRYQYSLKPRVHSLSLAKPGVRIFPRTPRWCLTGQNA
jgi:hypothetical protein